MNRKPGPQSAAALAVVAPLRVQPRVKPPRPLTPAERAHWRMAVDALPGDFFGPEHAQQLGAYVRHAALADALADKLGELDPCAPEWARINAAQVAHSKASLAFARSLRLTLNSRTSADAASTATRRGTGPATVEELRARYEENDDEDSAA